jgi:hypothetical protein
MAECGKGGSKKAIAQNVKAGKEEGLTKAQAVGKALGIADEATGKKHPPKK